ncbi:MAG: flagellar biosynthesis protein FlhA, partial [Actinomycetia bacterium]|nr:flagellar biosynthesis protein FlhA [Actinomycetes bacterium]
SLVIVMAVFYVARPVEFGVFPTILLLATLLRLALNVASTRVVLLHGHTGPQAAGRVIQSFGEFVIGGNFAVGVVVFIILTIINFVVVTKGAGRISEVSARFTLDAMPGKQMAIDADLNAGAIDDDEARRRRREVGAEADFYGAMDGASKFVKGDAIAAIIITFINLFGGFIVGVVQHHMPIGDAIQNYSVLSVGDGLVSQIPALLISIASGLIVTRSATDGDMGSDLIAQFGRQRQALQVAAFCIGGIALIPGLPKVPFLLVGGGLWVVASRIKKADATEAAAAEAEAAAPAETAEADLTTEMRVEPLELEVAFGLMDLVDPDRGGDLLTRVRSLRRKIALELGVVVPPVRTRDNIELPPHGYVIRVHGVEVGRGEAPAGQVLVLGDLPDGIPGTPTRDPVFGLEAHWVPREFGPQAELNGSTVIDRGSVITAHLAEVARDNAGRLLSRQDVKELVNAIAATDPALAEELGGNNLSLGEVQRVLQSLLEEGVGVRDLVRILETATERARVSKDIEGMTEAVRAALGPAISSAHASAGRLAVMTVEPLLEHTLLESLRTGEQGSFLALDPETAEAFALKVATTAREAEERGVRPVLVCSAQLRPAVRRLTKNVVPGLPVLAYGEIGSQLELETMGVIDLVPATV